MEPKITFTKNYTRDTALFLQEIWAKSHSFTVPELLGSPNPYLPGIVTYVNKGSLEIWEHNEATAWILNAILEKNLADGSFFNEQMKQHNKVLEDIKVLWDKKVLTTKEELITLSELFEKGIVGFNLFFRTAGNDKTPPELRAKALAMREKDTFFSQNDLLLQASIPVILPECKGYENFIFSSEIENPPSIEILMQRKEHFVVVDGTTKFLGSLTDFEAQNPLYHFAHEKVDNGVKEIKGQVGYKGKVQGRAKVLFFREEMSKLTVGDILISPMTTPDFLPAMEKAAAFVTDEGGITCHAAIVAREMKKPCVIGTRFATRLIKDGDMVEVDAEKGVVKILSNKQSPQWELVAKKGYNFCILLMDFVMRGFIAARSRTDIRTFKPLYFRQMDKGRWFDKNELESFKNDFIQRLESNPKHLKEVMSDYVRELNVLRTFWKDRSQNLSDVETLEFIVEKQSGLWPHLYLYVFFADYLSQRIKSIAKKYNLSAEEEHCLFIPREVSERIYEKGSLADMALSDDKEKTAKIHAHLEKYSHLGYSWFFGQELKQKDIEDRLVGISNEIEKVKASIEEHKENAEKTKKILEDHSFEKGDIDIVEGFQMMLFNTNALDDNYSYFLKESRTYFEKLAEKVGLTYSESIQCTINEIRNGLQSGSVNFNNKRIDEHVISLENDSIILLEGEAYQSQLSASAVNTSANDTNSKIRGVTASRGKVQGKVCIFQTVNDLGKIEKGDILVSVMTQPAFVPAMEKAAGIVTDEGGLTCHAAIISRELNKPCIVGTKKASSILKDGDMVEVDADKGIVTIIT